MKKSLADLTEIIWIVADAKSWAWEQPEQDRQEKVVQLGDFK